jgi:hypothetical protein
MDDAQLALPLLGSNFLKQTNMKLVAYRLALSQRD